jgi:hypothetical protein
MVELVVVDYLNLGREGNTSKSLLTIVHMFYYNYILFPFGDAAMFKLIGEPVKVHLDKDDLVSAFIWRKRLYRVEDVLDWWREPGDWWNGRAVRFFIRVDARNSSTGTYELYRLGEQWFLHRVLD